MYKTNLDCLYPGKISGSGIKIRIEILNFHSCAQMNTDNEQEAWQLISLKDKISVTF